VLDLERIARHRGSLLGGRPDALQPTQKCFESELLVALQSFDPRRVVYVESESRKIGDVQLPDELIAAMRGSSCIRVETPPPLRVALLKQEYEHFRLAREALANRLVRLAPLHGKKTVERWSTMALRGDHETLIAQLLELHYDPMYSRSIERNFPRHVDATCVEVCDISAAAFRAAARDVLDRVALEAADVTEPG
jgi:tRNA 2-selenouridine synthase